jgi:spore maturation protein SpmB
VNRTGLLAVLLCAVAAVVVVLSIPRGRAHVALSTEASMTRGAVGAQVTIVEFSDYQ